MLGGALRRDRPAQFNRQRGSEAPYGLRAVAVLRAVIGAKHHDLSVQQRKPNGRVRLIAVLPAGAGSSETLLAALPEQSLIIQSQEFITV